MASHRFHLGPPVAWLLFVIMLPLPALAADPPGWHHVENAREYHAAGKRRSAVIALKNALIENPRMAEARLMLGNIYLELRQGADAEKELRRAAELGISARETLAPLGEAMLLQDDARRLLEEVRPDPTLPVTELASAHALRGEAYIRLDKPEEARGAFETALRTHTATQRALLGLVRLAILEGKSDEAQSHLDRALALNPDSDRAWQLQGDLHQSLGRKQAAIDAYGKAIRLATTPFAAYLARALLRTEVGNYALAAEDLAAFRTALPEHPQGYYAQGFWHFRQAEYAPAIEAFEEALGRRPGDLRARYYLGTAYLAMGNLELAEMHLSRFHSAVPGSNAAAQNLGRVYLALRDFARAETILEPLLARHPGDARVLELMGKVRLLQGDVAAGNGYLRRAAEAQPDSAAGLTDLGIGLMAKGDFAAATVQLEKAVEANASDRRAEVLLILGYLKAQEFASALGAAQALQVKWKDSPDPFTFMGMAYAGLGDMNRARAAFEQALTIQPGNPSAASNLAVLALNDGNSDAARGYYEHVQAHFPGHENTLLKLAAMDAAGGDWEAYRERLSEAVAHNPRSLKPRVLLANLNLRAGRPLRAVAELREIQDEYGDHPAFLAAMGEAQLAAGEPNQALRQLQGLVERQPDSAPSRYLLARTLAVLKYKNDLEEQLFRALDMAPNHPQAPPLMTHLLALAKDAPEADRLLQKLKRKLPGHPQVVDLEGRLAMQRQQMEKAIALYREARQSFPEQNHWVVRLAQALWQSGDRDGSVAVTEDWLKGHADDAAVRFILANNYLALARNAEARSAFAQVVELAPNNTLALNNLAWLMRDDDPQAALEYAERAYALGPNPVVLDTLGALLLITGDNGRALDVLREASSKRPDDLSVRYRLAMALVRTGERGEAGSILKNLLEEGKSFAERPQAESLLRELGG